MSQRITADNLEQVIELNKEIKAAKAKRYQECEMVSRKLDPVTKLRLKRINTLMPAIIEAFENTNKEIKTNLLNDVIRDAVMLNQPPSYKGKRLKIYFVNQSGTMPPKFTFNVNSKGLVHFSYERYLENKIRESFDLEGTPIQIEFKNRGEE